MLYKYITCTGTSKVVFLIQLYDSLHGNDTSWNVNISMALCETVVTPVHWHWSYRSLAPSHQHILGMVYENNNNGICFASPVVLQQLNSTTSWYYQWKTQFTFTKRKPAECSSCYIWLRYLFKIIIWQNFTPLVLKLEYSRRFRPILWLPMPWLLRSPVAPFTNMV